MYVLFSLCSEEDKDGLHLWAPKHFSSGSLLWRDSTLSLLCAVKQQIFSDSGAQSKNAELILLSQVKCSQNFPTRRMPCLQFDELDAKSRSQPKVTKKDLNGHKWSLHLPSPQTPKALAPFDDQLPPPVLCHKAIQHIFCLDLCGSQGKMHCRGWVPSLRLLRKQFWWVG